VTLEGRSGGAVAAWIARDETQAVLPSDRRAIAESESLRALIVELVIADAGGDEIFDACAALGRAIAQNQCSPTLAAVTIDHAADALSARGAPWIVPARAALLEGFTAVMVERAVTDGLRAWEFPHCAVPIGPGSIAIAAGPPTDDDEALAAWAGRVAQACALQGIRRATLAGHEKARRALADAFAVVGVRVVTQEGSRT
jgi:hypothetical protein